MARTPISEDLLSVQAKRIRFCEPNFEAAIRELSEVLKWSGHFLAPGVGSDLPHRKPNIFSKISVMKRHCVYSIAEKAMQINL